MFTPKANHSNDLMALLSGQASGGAKADGLSKLMSESLTKEQMAEFSTMLADQGALQGISKNDLLNFFKQMSGSGKGELQAQEDLFSFMESNQGQELLKGFSFDGEKFVSAKGETLTPEQMIAKVKDISEGLVDTEGLQDLEAEKPVLKKGDFALNKLLKNEEVAAKAKTPVVKTGEDFLAQRKALQGKGQTPVVQVENMKAHPSMNTYMKSSETFKKQFIQAKAGEPVVNKSSEVSKTSEMVDGFDGLNNDSNLIGLEKSFSKNVDGNEVSTNSGETKVLDLSNISASNKSELISKIGNYIEQSYVAGQDSVEMIVNHDELGQFRVSAHKSGPGNQVQLEINTMTQQGQQFFVDNESEMIKTLSQNGIKLSDVKILPGSDIMLAGEGRSAGNESFSQGQGRGESGQFNQNSRQFGDNQNGEQRRRQLWKNAQEFQQNLSA